MAFPRRTTTEETSRPKNHLNSHIKSNVRVKSGVRDRSKHNDSVLSHNSKNYDLKAHPFGLMDKHRGHPTITSLLEENQVLHNHLKFYNQKLTRMIDYRGYSETMDRIRTGKKSATTAKEKKIKNLQREIQNNEKHLAIQLEDVRRTESKRDRLTNPSYLADINRDISDITHEINAVKKEIHGIEVENRKENKGVKDKSRARQNPGSSHIAALLKEIDLVSRKNQDLRHAIEEGATHIETQNQYYEDSVAKKEKDVREAMDKVGIAVETDHTREYKMLLKAIEEYNSDTIKVDKRHEKAIKTHQKELEEITLGYEIVHKQVEELNNAIEKQIADIMEMIEIAKLSQSPHGMKILDRIKDGLHPGEEESRDPRHHQDSHTEYSNPFGQKYTRLDKPSHSHISHQGGGYNNDAIPYRSDAKLVQRPQFEYREELPSTNQSGIRRQEDYVTQGDSQRLLEEKMRKLDQKTSPRFVDNESKSHAQNTSRKDEPSKSHSPQPDRKIPEHKPKHQEDEIDWLGNNQSTSKPVEPSKKSPFAGKFTASNDKVKPSTLDPKLSDLKNSDVRITEQKKPNEELSVPDYSKKKPATPSKDPDLDMILGDPAFADPPKKDPTPPAVVQPAQPATAGPKTLPTQPGPKPVTIGGPKPVTMGGPKPVKMVVTPNQTNPSQPKPGQVLPTATVKDPMAGIQDIDEEIKPIKPVVKEEKPKKDLDFDGFGDDDDKPAKKKDVKKGDDPFGFLGDEKPAPKAKKADSDIFGDDIFGDDKKKAKPAPQPVTVKPQPAAKPIVNLTHEGRKEAKR